MSKTAIITGASRGVGRELAEILYKKSYNLGLVARKFNPEDLNILKSAKKQKVVLYKYDLSVEKSVLEFCDKIKEDFSEIDIIVNNAGYNLKKAEVEDFTIEEINKMLDLNLKAPIFIVHELLPDMKKRNKGQIINIVSTIANDCKKLFGPYCASKAGLLGFSRVLSKECSKHNIKVTSFIPGGINTGFREIERPNFMSAESVAKLVVQTIEAPDDLVVDEIIIKPICEIQQL